MVSDEKLPGVYVIRNLITQKEYVGSAVSICARAKKHTRDLKRGNHHNTKLQNSWNKHGERAFVLDVLAVVEDKTQLLAKEQEWLDALDTVAHGYNLACTAGSLLGFKHAPGVYDSRTAARTGKKHSAETLKKMSDSHLGQKGRPMSEEHKAKLVAISTGRVVSAETRRKLSESHMGQPRPKSAEYRAKLSAAQKGRPLTPAHAAAAAQGRRDAIARKKELAAQLAA